MLLQNTRQDSVPSFDPVQPAVVSFLTPPPQKKKKTKKKNPPGYEIFIFSHQKFILTF